MKNYLKSGIILLCAVSSLATVAETKNSFCSNRSNSESIKSNAFSSDQFLSFRNQGGLMNAGVCWWHSRFQRNAMVLARFRPEFRVPDESRIKKIIKAIRKGKHVVEIPGFHNMSEFSYQNAGAIQRELDKWQKSDGMIRQQWIVGLLGTSNTTSEKFEKKMNELYQYVKVEGNIAYEKLQIAGIDAHAWLVSDVIKTARGYDLKVLDSNYQRTQKYSYVKGMTSFYHSYYGNFVPYLERKREYKKVLKVVKKYCK